MYLYVYKGIGKVTGVTVFCGPVGLIIQCTIGWNVSKNVIYMHVLMHTDIAMHLCRYICTYTYVPTGCTYVCVL